MKRAFMPRRPSAAMIIAVAALFVALGGTSYAAFSLPKNSVGAKQLKNGAVTTKKIKNRAVTAAKINPAGLTAPNATHANSANTASSATTATNATNASHANNADNASNAGHATSAGVINGADASNLVSGYATITSGTSPTVKNSGGKRVSSVTVTYLGTGDYAVTFNGNFPGVTSIDQVATFASMWNSNTYDVASASNDQSTASSTSITIRVFTWSTASGTPGTLEDRDFSVMFMTP